MHWQSPKTAMLALALILAGCATAPDATSPLPEPIPTETRLPPLTTRDHGRILAAFGGEYSAPGIERLAIEVLDRLGAASDLPDQRYRLTVLNSPTINAFALPSGHLYITRGMLALINDMSEFAAVVGHEMAHVSARHANQREDQVRTSELVAVMRARLLNDMAGAEARREAARVSLANFSRTQELEADTIGVALIAKAGFDPYGASRFLETMDRNAALRSPSQASGGGPDFLASHPSTPERIRQAVLAARQHMAPDGRPRDRERYLRAIDGITFGEDPRQGVVRGRSFIHPRLGFTVTAPEGFTLENSRQAVTGLGPNEMAIRLDVVRVQANQTLTSYLASGWIDGLAPETVEAVTINGFQAATAVARGSDWSFRIFVVRFGSEVYRIIYAARDLNGEVDGSFRASMETFRRLTSAEAAVKPARVKTLRAGEGDTVLTFARRMQVPDRADERFRVLNGLGDGEQPRGGELVKVIAE
ncbi:MAG: M48 family metalloprotease [Phreatobacter sp.]|uniref:M48 family metalloprotease n=1 Tax=Phreatobacter sp. TaxID=1966341 RepID=UPI0027323FE7|nr:M48 family metalloprotease [Phreatobacter sp.]MDP2801784.1 M48 family metalloprotease [Phreatobacter sp.]